MDPERWKQLDRLFQAAIELPAGEREPFLARECADDPELEKEVKSLLDSHQKIETSFLAGPPTQVMEAIAGDLTGEATKMNHNLAGRSVSHYQIISKLGSGGMGEVWRARDTKLNREVALKILPGVLSHEPERLLRFKREAQVLASLNHPNIAAIYGFEESGGVSALVMELVEGQTLAQRLKSAPMALDEVLSIAGQIAEALQYAHEKGIIHRDLKPANIIVTPKGKAKVLDFGLAKAMATGRAGGDIGDSPTASAPMTESGMIMGTPRYMSPEQALGENLDTRTDLWSFGAVLYETLAGKPPFEGDGGVSVLRAVLNQTPKPVRDLRPDVPKALENIVSRALEKNLLKRYSSAAEMERDLSSVTAQITAPASAARPELRLSLRFAIPGAVLLAILIAVAGWLYHRSAQREWARDQAIPQIAELHDARKDLAAFVLLKKAERILPGDPHLAQLAEQNTQVISITSSPPGAAVEIKDYLAPASPWFRLGTTPLKNIVIPAGYFRWRISKAGVGEYEAAPFVRNPSTGEGLKNLNFPLDKESAAPAGMSWVSPGPWLDYIGDLGWVGPYRIPPYYIGRYEVTNREYQKFVDAGGYAKRQYWTEPFMRDGREMKWEDAMALFRDSTGRPGPSTWEGGHFPEGQGDYPVSGVSWYEASAYAAFASNSLPTLAQWYQTAAPFLGSYIVQESNISLSKLAPVGKYPGLGVYGTYDMAGNVKEWALNDTDGNTKFILGGAWMSQTYLYGDPEALSPFDRSPENGFRCVRNTAPLPVALQKPLKRLQRDFSKLKPVPDAVYGAYLQLYAYNKAPLDARVEGVVQDTADWREEKVTYKTAYDNQRMAAYLFLPKHVKPPYQTVVFNPSARVLDLHDSRHLGDITFFDYVVQSGRAVLYPVYYGTYERQGGRSWPDISDMTKQSKDLGRSLDYLDTRSDIDKSKIAYLGVSMGSAFGVIYATIAQKRLKTAIFLDGGYFLSQPLPGGDQAAFAPRLKLPVLMVNGRYDYDFPPKQSQDPLFQMLGTPDRDKEHVMFDTPHDVRDRRAQLVKVVLDWLDKYLGRAG